MPATLPPSVRPSIAARPSLRDAAAERVRAGARRAALHEAAHVIAAEVCELPRSLDVLVIGDGGRTRTCRPAGGASDPEALIAVDLAGIATDLRDGHRDALERARHDLRQASAVDGGDAALFRRGLDRAIAITANYRPAIEHLATAIRDAGGRLVGADLDAAITAAMGAMPHARRRRAAAVPLAIRQRELFEAALREVDPPSLLWRGHRIPAPAADVAAARDQLWREAGQAALREAAHPTP